MGCADGVLGFPRYDVSAATAAALARWVANGASWSEPDALPPGLDWLTAQLNGDHPITTVEASLIFALPGGSRGAHEGFVCSGSPDGEALLAAIGREGPPRHLVEAGFLGAGDFWPPWCAAVDKGQIAALAFAARLTDTAAAIGIYTFPGWRGRGLAAAVTAAWSSHPDLLGRDLFYSCQMSNGSSRRVTERLDLDRIGLGLRIT